MLAKKFRLPIGESSIKKQKSLRGNYFFLKREPSNLPISRFGIIISRKNEKSAVKRNKLKRAILNFVRLRRLHRIPGFDFLIIVSPAAFRATKEEFNGELNKFLIPE